MKFTHLVLFKLRNPTPLIPRNLRGVFKTKSMKHKTEKSHTVFIAKTRDEAHEKMKLGEDFEAPSRLSKYNRSMIDFWADKYNYKKCKSRHGYDIYKPI